MIFEAIKCYINIIDNIKIMNKLFDGFKNFILRGNAVDLAVGVVIGASFGTVVTALVKDLLTPLIAAIVKKPDFSKKPLFFCWPVFYCKKT